MARPDSRMADTYMYLMGCLKTNNHNNYLKGLSYEIDFENVDENGQILP